MSYEAWGDGDDDGYRRIEDLLNDGWRAGEDLSEAMHDVVDERLRQQDVEGWTPEHDDQHNTGDLSRAAACYAAHASAAMRLGYTITEETYRSAEPPPGVGWPWDEAWWKPKDLRRDLVRAAALIVAEIERLDRASPPSA